MLAYQMVEWGKAGVLKEVPVPEPGAGEVLVRVGGAGACHSDLHIMDWPAGAVPYPLPFTLGHENAGWVAAVGAGVSGWSVGDGVAVYGHWGCGRCRACLASRENYCERRSERGRDGGGLGWDGGMAEYLLVPSARHLVELEGMDPRDAAPLTDAGLTPYHAIKRSLGLLVPGSTAVVIGVGGLGHLAVQILRAITPARIIAVDLSAERLAAAEADLAVVTDGNAVRTIREFTDGLGAEVVLDFVGSDATLGLASRVARVEGHLTIVGLAGGTLGVRSGRTPWECSVAVMYWGSQVELVEVLALGRAGKIRPRVERFPLSRVAEVYQRLREGQIDGRAVVCPNG